MRLFHRHKRRVHLEVDIFEQLWPHTAGGICQGLDQRIPAIVSCIDVGIDKRMPRDSYYCREVIAV